MLQSSGKKMPAVTSITFKMAAGTMQLLRQTCSAASR
jgi:hypothetical protein